MMVYPMNFLTVFLKCKQSATYLCIRTLSDASHSTPYLTTTYIGAKASIIGKEHSEKRSLEKYLARKRAKDASVHYLVDIGLPYTTKVKRNERTRRRELLKNQSEDKNLIKIARFNKLEVPLDNVYDEWILTDGPRFIKKIAEHYGIFEHLFGEAFFHPVTPMSISFKNDEDFTPVYFGNVIKPKSAQEEPLVDIGNKSNLFHTLILSNLDGHLTKEDGEYVHWMVANIPEGDVNKGEVICSYLPPFPTKGTGYHRYAFVLYQHDLKIDFSEFKKGQPTEPSNRDFNTYEFYRDRQDLITPSSLLFYQTDWDYSVSNVFHNIFDMPEPRYEYDFRDMYQRPPQWFPLQKPFNTYLDRYRDPKQISKEVLTKKLKTLNPFEKPEPKSKFPNLHTSEDTAGKASWIGVEVKKQRLGWGNVYNDNKDILDPK